MLLNVKIWPCHFLYMNSAHSIVHNSMVMTMTPHDLDLV